MSRRRSPQPQDADASKSTRVDGLGERLALFALLALIPIRTTINETLTFEVPRMFRDIEATQAHPGYTLFFSLLIFGIGLWRWLSCWPQMRRSWLTTGGELGLVLLAAAGVISFTLAGQKHLALTGALNLLAVIAYGFTLRSLLNTPARVRLACYVLVATGAVLAVKGGIQHFFEHPNTLAFFEANKAELLKNSLYSEGMLHDYEQRLRSAELSGYYPHSNVFGSHVILLLLAALAPVVDRLRRKLSGLTLIAPLLVFALLAVIVFGAMGKGPIVGALIGLAVFAIGVLGGGMLRRWRYLALAAAWMVTIGGAIGVAAVLQQDEAALGRSLQFRHMYWRGAADMVADRGLGGVGPLNFGRHFTRYKPVECPEEVEAPHSWIVRLLTEWGLLGLVGFIVLLAGMSWRATQLAGVDAVTCNTDEDNAGKKRPSDAKLSGARTPDMVFWGLSLAAIVLGVLARQYAATPYLIIEVVGLGLVLPLVLAMLLCAIETRDNSAISNDTLGPIAIPLFAGAVGFLAHTAIDLALFEGGPATTCFAMIGTGFAALSLRRRALDDASAATAPVALRRTAPFVGLLIVLIGGGLFLVAGRYQQSLSVARRNPVGTRLWRAYMKQPQAMAYQAANTEYVLDATSLSEWVEQLIPRARTISQFGVALDAAEEHLRRDPFNALGHNLKGTLLRRRYDVSEDCTDLSDAAREYEMYLATYPTHPDRHIYLADVLVQLADETNQPELRERAAHHLRRALELEAQRIYVSEPNRKTPQAIEQIEKTIAQLEAAVPPAITSE